MFTQDTNPTVALGSLRTTGEEPSHWTDEHCPGGQHLLHSPFIHQVPELKETERIGLCVLIPAKMLQEDLQAPLTACTAPTTNLSHTYHLPFLPHLRVPFLLCALSSWPAQQGFLSSFALRQKPFSLPLVYRMSRLDPENFMT